MSDFLEAIEKGILGLNDGLVSGLERFCKFIDNIQKETIISVGAMKKTGKTAFVDFFFILMVYLLNVKPGLKQVRWIYFSYEISRIQKMAKFASYFMLIKHGKLVSKSYILSRGDNKLSEEDRILIEEIYNTELVTLFGKYNKHGKLIEPGLIDFHENKTNPTGIRNYLINYFKETGTLHTYTTTVEKDGKKVEEERLGNYESDIHTIIIHDHIGLTPKERGFTKKENLDKLSEYYVIIRNLFKATIIPISQFNRDMNKVDRLKFSGDTLKPTAEDWKDTGNIAEDANMLIALFNPSLYPHIKNYMGYDIDKLGKRFVSLHLLESRDTEGFVDLGLGFYGECGHYVELPKPDEMTDEIYEQIINNEYEGNNN